MTVQATRRVPQWARVLFALREAGRAGITTNYIRNRMLPPIANPAQRIIELEARGHVISSTPERREGHATVARYRLEHDAERAPMSAPAQAMASVPPQESFESLLAEFAREAA